MQKPAVINNSAPPNKFTRKLLDGTVRAGDSMPNDNTLVKLDWAYDDAMRIEDFEGSSEMHVRSVDVEELSL
jgi:hypothetical protein